MKGNGLFTPEELEEMRRADAEIDAEDLTMDELRASRERDRAAKMDRMDNKERQRKEKQRKRYAANKEKVADYKRAYYAANKEKVADYQRAYYAANKEKVADYKRAYRKRKKEEKE